MLLCVREEGRDAGNPFVKTVGPLIVEGVVKNVLIAIMPIAWEPLAATV